MREEQALIELQDNQIVEESIAPPKNTHTLLIVVNSNSKY